MTILWQCKKQGINYQVKAAGQTRRLYTDGVFHSQYNPNKVLTGGVWDLLMLPVFFYSPHSIQRVLLLGVGGGAVLHQLQHFIRPRSVTGIELNAVHLFVARRYFQLRYRNTRLYRADAVSWVKQFQGEKFDLIIDDLFGGLDGEPVRAVPVDAKWGAALLKVLSPGGMIVTNFVSPREMRQSAFISNNRLAGRFAATFELTTAHEENAVAAFLQRNATRRQFEQHISKVKKLSTLWRNNPHGYKLRQLKR